MPEFSTIRFEIEGRILAEEGGVNDGFLGISRRRVLDEIDAPEDAISPTEWTGSDQEATP